jgi:repressor LexA
MSRTTLHPSQRQLLNLLAETADDPLTIRELQERIGASSTSVVAHHLQQLERKGHLKRNPYNPRDYQVVASGPEDEVALLNLYGAARCGPGGSILDGDPVDRIPIASRLLSFPVAEAFMLRAKGHSMTPRINEGDLVIARKSRDPVDGRVYVCVNDQECLIKIVRKLGSKFYLESYNSMEFPILQAARDFHVEGEVKQIISGKF